MPQISESLSLINEIMSDEMKLPFFGSLSCGSFPAPVVATLTMNIFFC